MDGISLKYEALAQQGNYQQCEETAYKTGESFYQLHISQEINIQNHIL